MIHIIKSWILSKTFPRPIFTFYTLVKHLKTSGFKIFSRGKKGYIGLKCVIEFHIAP